MADTITRWDPFQQLARLRQDIDAMFGRVSSAGAIDAPWVPAVDVEQTEDTLVYKLDVPGIEVDDLAVQVHDRMLTVSGERREEHEEKHEGYVSRERLFGSFSRSFLLPEGIVESDISAECTNGVLRISMPRPTTSHPHEIEVKAG
jgi:HSP20 family protein